jgi:DNA-directed RNA polymerase specialized sigma24 family protein
MSEESSHIDGSADSVTGSRRNGLFDSTPWSEVLAAGDSRHESNRSALEKLCVVYWPPLYAYVRRKVRDQHLAQDLTQSFFERLLAGKSLKLADPARGRFRCFLIQAFEWHLANAFREGRAAKRGGDVQIFPLDFSSSSSELADDGSLSPAQLFEREWALTLLNQTMQRLHAEQNDPRKQEQFAALKAFLSGTGPAGGYAAVCANVGLSESAARMAVSRLRSRYRELLREEILKTVASSQDVDDEINCLFRAISVQ